MVNTCGSTAIRSVAPFHPSCGCAEVLNATHWVLLQASKSVEQAVFVGIVEPPVRGTQVEPAAGDAVWDSCEMLPVPMVGYRN